MNDTKKCLHCGVLNFTDAKFCQGCGQSLPATTKSTQFCVHCGAPLNVTARFCPHCGNTTEATPAQAPVSVPVVAPAQAPVSVPVVVSEVSSQPPKVSKKKWWLIGIASLLLCSMVGGIVALIVTNKAPSFDDVLTTVMETIEEIEKKYLDEDGYVPYDEKDAVIREVFAAVEKMEEVTYCEKNATSVYYTLQDSVGVHYMVPIEGFAGSGSEMSIYSYQPHYDEFTNKYDDYQNIVGCSWIDDLGNFLRNEILVKPELPNLAIDNLLALRFTGNQAKALYDDGVTLDAIQNMQGGGVILWVGHGVYSQAYHSALVTSIKYTEQFRQNHLREFEDHLFEITGNLRVAVTSRYFDEHIEDGALNDSIIYLGACHSGEDDVLANMFLKKGASAVYANTDTVYQAYNNRMCKSIVDALCDGSTVGQALEIARTENGEYDNVAFRVVQTHAQVVAKGETSLTLEELNRRISSHPSGNTTTTTTTTGSGNHVNSGTTTNSGNSNSQNKTPPSINQVNNALHANNYYILRNDYGVGDVSEWPSGVTRAYCYDGVRCYDEYGNVFAYNDTINPENLMDRDDIVAGDYIYYVYVECESVTAAKRVFDEILDDDIYEGRYSSSSGPNWYRTWQYFAVDTENILCSRIDNVILLFYAEWDEFQDAGITYDNAAIKAMEQIGF